MIGKILSQLLGSAGEDFEAADEGCEELMEFEEGGWVIVNLPGEMLCYSHLCRSICGENRRVRTEVFSVQRAGRCRPLRRTPWRTC